MLDFNDVHGNGKTKNSNNNSDNNSNKPKKQDPEEVINSKKTKDQTHIFKGYYLERKVANRVDKNSSRGIRGSKSDYVNTILKNHFIEIGDWDDDE